MTEDARATAAPAAAPTAGRLLREARERHGLHVAALAASIKVAPRKLELLEADRFDELPDATFTRALAQTVCRALKIDSAPVMQLLPPPAGQRLYQVGEGLNTPFRERPGAAVQSELPSIFAKPALWITALIAVAAVALYVLPKGSEKTLRTAAPAASMAAGDAPRVPAGELPGMPPETALPGSATPATALPLPGSTPAEPPASAAPAALLLVPPGPIAPVATAAPLTVPVVVPVAATSPLTAPAVVATPEARLLQVQTSSPSWVDVTDARGRSLVARMVKPGEAVGVDGAPPLRVRIGNAAGTQLVFRGQPTDLKAYTRDNVARLELQ